MSFVAVASGAPAGVKTSAARRQGAPARRGAAAAAGGRGEHAAAAAAAAAAAPRAYGEGSNAAGEGAGAVVPRRAAISAAAAAAAAAACTGLGGRAALAAPAYEAGDGAEVSAYLPAASKSGFVKFVPNDQRTPALRSGVVRPYSFMIPAKHNWKEQKVANAISGNYCQPRCDEPTTEVKFASPTDGSMQVIISPLTKMTSAQDPAIQDVGSPEELIQSFGPYITGGAFEPEDCVSARSEKQEDGQTYYYYEVQTPFALTGEYNVSALTFKGSVALLFNAYASDKQWSKDGVPDRLRDMVGSFRV